MSMRVGFGYDVHRFTTDRPLKLGGVDIPHTKGLLGHSDADVLIHSICDAILGAAAMGDIGTHFPDDTEEFRGADSRELLKKVISMIKEEGYSLINVDSTLVMEKPKLRQHIDNIRISLADLMQLDKGSVSVKATTNEKMGFAGREEGVAAFAVVMITNG